MSAGLQDTLGMHKFVSAVFKLQWIKCQNSVIIIAGSEKDVFGFPGLPPLLSWCDTWANLHLFLCLGFQTCKKNKEDSGSQQYSLSVRKTPMMCDVC